ncbi:MAG: ParB/RepB/Spo0J family partition protein [Oscillospiraceae bacterium]|jgi:ParB family chromosome partitioning protein|nr:ParB/RepB/Spo0J family partition protein [Oscillospiraceae bacterium]
MAQKKKGLGKGLDALFEDNSGEEGKNSVELKISEIEPNREQARRNFEASSMAELAESIKQHGILSPLLVRPLPAGNYQLVAGERRWRAARMAGLSEVPVIIRELSSSEAAALSLIENLQRENLNPIEEARGYRRLMEEFELTQEDVAKRVNKSRPVITNSMRLLNLPEVVIEHLEEGRLSQGHGKVLLGIENRELNEAMADSIITNKLSVRETEKAVKKLLSGGKRKEPSKAEENPEREEADDEYFGKDSFYKELELAINQELGRKVSIVSGKRGGTITIEFFSKEDLNDIAYTLAGINKNSRY